MIRILTFIVGLLGATGLSQFPEFSQQYLQRLAGAVDELRRVVADFDASAEGVGMTREQALAALSEGEFQQARQADMRRTITRSEDLSADLEALRSASMLRRVMQPQRFTDAEIARAAWGDFKPAVPVTATGAGFAAAGFGLGWGFAALFWGVLGWPFRALRRRSSRPKEVSQGQVEVGPGPLVAPARAGQGARPRQEPQLRGGSGARPALPIGFLTRTGAAPHKVVGQGQAAQVAVLMVDPEGSVSGQGSATFDTVLVCHDGAGQLRYDGQSRAIQAGELALVPPGTAWELTNPSTAAVLRLFSIEPRTGLAALTGEALPPPTPAPAQPA